MYPLEDDEGRHRTSSNSLKVKVRMTETQLKELMARVDMSKENSNQLLGRLILNDCLQGRFTARIIASADGHLGPTCARVCSLSTIFEEERESF